MSRTVGQLIPASVESKLEEFIVRISAPVCVVYFWGRTGGLHV